MTARNEIHLQPVSVIPEAPVDGRVMICADLDGQLWTIGNTASYSMQPKISPGAHIADASPATTTSAPTTLSVTLLSQLVTEVAAGNSRYNDLATKYNDLVAKFNNLLLTHENQAILADS